MVAPAELLEPMTRVQEYTASFVAPFIQMAGVAALRGPQDHIQEWRDECRDLRLQVANMFNTLPGIHCPITEGTTFLFPRFPGAEASVEMAERLLNKALVTVTPGSGFGDSGEGHLRVSLMRSPRDRVLEGVERIIKVLSG